LYKGKNVNIGIKGLCPPNGHRVYVHSVDIDQFCFQTEFRNWT